MKKKLIFIIGGAVLLCAIVAVVLIFLLGGNGRSSSSVKNGNDGKSGTSIQSIEYDEDGNLVVTFTNGTTQTVTVPEDQPANTTEGLHFLDKGNGEYCVAGLGIASDIDIVIPSTYKGRPVTEIREGAFQNEDNIISVTIPDSVTAIGNNAFYGCYDLSAVNFSDGLLTIGDYAFASCPNLYNFTYPASVTSFGSHVLSDSAVVGLTIQEGVTAIPAYAFYNCNNIASINLPDTVISIGEYAFANCSNLLSINLGNGIQTIGAYAFSSSYLSYVSFGSTISSIGENAFEYCSNLATVNIVDIASWCGVTFGNIYANPLLYAESLTLNNSMIYDLVIPESVIGISDFAFYNYDYLSSVVIPESATAIGQYAFYDCDALATVYLGNGVELIEDYAFYDCENLYTITFGSGISTIGKDVFYDCYNLEYLNVNDVAAWCGIEYDTTGDINFLPLYLAGSLRYNNTVITQLNVPNTVTAINQYAFYGAQTLEQVVLADSVETIGYYAFANCDTLDAIAFGAGISQIGQGAFYNTDINKVDIKDVGAWCSVVFNGISSTASTHPFFSADEMWIDGAYAEEIVIPYGVEEIGEWAFAYMPNQISNIEFAETVQRIGDYAFYESDIVEVRLPENVTAIGNAAFYNCDLFENIGLTNNVESVGGYAFSDCAILTIYYEESSYNNDWESYWNYSNRPVQYNWNPQGVTYSFEENGAEEIEDVTAYFAIDLPELTYEDYILFGWYTTSTFTGNAISDPYYSSNDVTLYARWMTETEYNQIMADGSSFDRAKTAYSGNSYYVSITSANQKVYFKFVPTYSGYYTISSSNNSGNSSDTYGYLYNSQRSQIASNDDYNDRNFRIRQYLTAGETYYIGAGMYGSNIGNYYLYITQG